MEHATLPVNAVPVKWKELIAPPLSLGRHKKKQTMELLNKERMHVRFVDHGEDEAAIDNSEELHHAEGSQPNGAAEPRAILTEVYIEDRKPRNRRRRRRSAGTGQPVTHTDESTTTEAESGTAQPEQPKDYSAFPALQGFPKAEQRIAFKLLEMSQAYTPEISDHKEASVVAFDAQRYLVTLKLDTVPKRREPEYDEDGELILGKFEIPPDEDYSVDDPHAQEVITVDLKSLLDVRVLS
ncbi:hypothetical protein BC832DRAFT_555139 [Gaertneriomyces semiglobifer]|nr:hypothetical protein BC832DRAFT_555139 [Gaertneriomyces semiglobifer]